MKYDVEIDINLPRDKVIGLFDNQDNLYKWQRGLKSIEHVEGTPGEEGAKSKIHYQMGKRKVEMTETIIKKNLPDAFDAIYVAKGVVNTMKNSFEEVDDSTTRWKTHQEFNFKGFMKLFTLMGKGPFRKQSMKFMVDFKAFAEDGKDVRDTAP